MVAGAVVASTAAGATPLMRTAPTSTGYCSNSTSINNSSSNSSTRRYRGNSRRFLRSRTIRYEGSFHATLEPTLCRAQFSALMQFCLSSSGVRHHRPVEAAAARPLPLRGIVPAAGRLEPELQHAGADQDARNDGVPEAEAARRGQHRQDQGEQGVHAITRQVRLLLVHSNSALINYFLMKAANKAIS